MDRSFFAADHVEEIPTSVGQAGIGRASFSYLQSLFDPRHAIVDADIEDAVYFEGDTRGVCGGPLIESLLASSQRHIAGQQGNDMGRTVRLPIVNRASSGRGGIALQLKNFAIGLRSLAPEALRDRFPSREDDMLTAIGDVTTLRQTFKPKSADTDRLERAVGSAQVRSTAFIPQASTRPTRFWPDAHESIAMFGRGSTNRGTYRLRPGGAEAAHGHPPVGSSDRFEQIRMPVRLGLLERR